MKWQRNEQKHIVSLAGQCAHTCILAQTLVKETIINMCLRMCAAALQIFMRHALVFVSLEYELFDLSVVVRASRCGGQRQFGNL